MVAFCEHTGQKLPKSTPKYAESRVLERLVAAMAVRSCSMAWLSRATGIPYRSLQNYLAGRVKLSLPVAAKLADALRVSLDWLAYGRGATFDPIVLREALDALAASDARSLRERADAFADFYLSTYRDEYDLAVTSAPPDVPLPGRPAPDRPPARPPVRRPKLSRRIPNNPASPKQR